MEAEDIDIFDTTQTRRLHKLDAIWHTASLLRASGNVHDVLNTALAEVMHAVKAEAGTLWLLDDNDKFLFPFISSGPMPLTRGMRLPNGEGMAGWVTKEATSLIVADVRNDERWSGRFDQKTGYETRSILCLPLLTQHGCAGCIQLLNKLDQSPFDANDLLLCEDLAVIAAIALADFKIETPEISSQQTLIRLENIHKNYGMGEVTVNVLENVSLEIYSRELLVILGASGSGKSTLLNLLGGMDRPSSGQILLDQQDISNASDKELTLYRQKDVGFVFQFYNLIPDLTAAENVAIASELINNPMTVDEVLEEVGLLAKKDRFPAQMSGGEQQRVAIARAIVKKPRLLLCDEPTGALDYATGKAVLQLLEGIARRHGSTVIIVTHNSAFGAIADRVIKIRSGRIVEVQHNPRPAPAAEIEW